MSFLYHYYNLYDDNIYLHLATQLDFKTAQ